MDRLRLGCFDIDRARIVMKYAYALIGGWVIGIVAFIFTYDFVLPPVVTSLGMAAVSAFVIFGLLGDFTP